MYKMLERNSRQIRLASGATGICYPLAKCAICWTLILSVGISSLLAVEVKEEGSRIKVSNNFFAASFNKEQGAMLEQLSYSNFEAPRITGANIYTDWGILKDGRYPSVGAHNEKSAQLRVSRRNNVVIITVKGRLKDKRGQESGFAYEVEYQIGRSPFLKAKVVLIAERDFHSARGFLAIMFSFAGATEWMARTEEGWLFRDVDVADARVFQSRDEFQLKRKDGLLGIGSSKSESAIMVRLKRAHPEGSIENSLIHCRQNGVGGIFFAWCDGQLTRDYKSGSRCELDLEIAPLRFSELMGVKMQGYKVQSAVNDVTASMLPSAVKFGGLLGYRFQISEQNRLLKLRRSNTSPPTLASQKYSQPSTCECQ